MSPMEKKFGKKKRAQRINTLRKELGTDKRVTFGETILKMNPTELKQRREHLRKEYGFTV